MAYQPVGDTLALAILAFNLYRKGYQVAKHAPDEFKDLLGELDIFKQTVWKVQRSVKNNEEGLGEDIITICTNVLRNDFQPLVSKYEKLAYAERGQHWLRRFQFAADQEAIRSAYLRLDRAQQALQNWLTLDTRDLCVQYFESLKKEILVQQRRSELQLGSHPLERAVTRGSVDHVSNGSFDQRIDSVLGQDESLGEIYPSAYRLPTYGPHGAASVGFRDPFNALALQDHQGGAQTTVGSPHRTSFNLNSTLDAQDSRGGSDSGQASVLIPSTILRGSLALGGGSILSSDVASDTNDSESNTTGSSADRRASIVDEKFFKQFERGCTPRPQLEEVFQASATDDVDAPSDTQRWIYRAVWWVVKAHKIWSILNDARASLSTPASPTTYWLTENITLEQTVVDMMKADFILHRIVLERLKTGDQLTWASTRRLQELLSAIKHGMVRESQGDSLETSVLLKQRTSLMESFVQPLELEDAMPEALDTMESSSRFLEFDEDIAGNQGETVLYRTFVNAQIGDKGYARKSPNAPYLLVLWMQKYEADFQISLLNQYGSLSLNMSMTREAVLQYQEQLTAHGNDLRLDFPGQKAIVKFLTNSNADDFLARPLEFFSHVKDRYPRQDEFLVFRTGIHSYQGPRRITQRKWFDDNTGQQLRPCEISLYNHVPSKLWKMTRRLVLCSVPSKRAAPQPFSTSLWLPLDHVRISVSSREIKLQWSDCGHLEIKGLGDYREEYGYVYKAHEPNQELHLVFKTDTIAAEFAKHILLPFETGLRLEKQIRNVTSIQSLRMDKQETRVVLLCDLEAPQNSGYYALVSTHHSPNGHSHSSIRFAYADNDIRVNASLFEVELLQLRQSLYLSGYSGLPSIETTTDLDNISACRTIRAIAGSQSFKFDGPNELMVFLSALTGWRIVFSRQARNIQLGAKGLRLSSSVGAGEVQLWTQQRNNPRLSQSVVRLAVRGVDRSGEPRWYTTSISGHGELEQLKGTRVAVKPIREPLQEGSLLETRLIRASNDRQDNNAGMQNLAEQQPQKHTKLTIEFSDQVCARELCGVVERLMPGNWTSR